MDFEATCGSNIGGYADWYVGFPEVCALRCTDSGLLTELDTLTAVWEGVYQAGLFQANIKPGLLTTLSDLHPCTFSGYAGLKVTTGWQPAVMSGVHAATSANLLQWSHDGGPVANDVFGWYLVDGTGNLVWAERFCPAPKTVDSVGQVLRLAPRFTLGNEFPSL